MDNIFCMQLYLSWHVSQGSAVTCFGVKQYVDDDNHDGGVFLGAQEAARGKAQAQKCLHNATSVKTRQSKMLKDIDQF